MDRTDHAALAARLEQRVFHEPADTPADLRRSMGERASGGPAITPPYDEIARQIGEAAYRVTDAQVATLRTKTGTERATFELIAAAAVGAALERWRQGAAAIDEAVK
jgi:hypothetical protein